MSNINLRPWRDERRKERQQQYIIVLVFVVVAAAAAMFAWNQQVSGLISDQRQRNAFLNQEIKAQESRIAEIKDLQIQRTKLIDRMTVIQRLQGDRPIIVRIFDELARTLPNGVYFESLSRTGDVIAIKGVADKPNSISDLLRNLDKSIWFKDAFLSNINAIKDGSGEATGNGFNITVKQTKPTAEQIAADGGSR
jgi:type IV pilus assembly protein PilN